MVMYTKRFHLMSIHAKVVVTIISIVTKNCTHSFWLGRDWVTYINSWCMTTVRMKMLSKKYLGFEYIKKSNYLPDIWVLHILPHNNVHYMLVMSVFTYTDISVYSIKKTMANRNISCCWHISMQNPALQQLIQCIETYLLSMSAIPGVAHSLSCRS